MQLLWQRCARERYPCDCDGCVPARRPTCNLRGSRRCTILASTYSFSRRLFDYVNNELVIRCRSLAGRACPSLALRLENYCSLFEVQTFVNPKDWKRIVGGRTDLAQSASVRPLVHPSAHPSARTRARSLARLSVRPSVQPRARSPARAPARASARTYACPSHICPQK